MMPLLLFLLLVLVRRSVDDNHRVARGHAGGHGMVMKMVAVVIAVVAVAVMVLLVLLMMMMMMVTLMIVMSRRIGAAGVDRSVRVRRLRRAAAQLLLVGGRSLGAIDVVALETLVLVLVFILEAGGGGGGGRLGVAATAHAYVAPDTDATALLGDDAAERGALGQARELLRAEDGKGLGLDLEAPVDEGLGRVRSGHAGAGAGGARLLRRFGVGVLGVLGLLVEVEAQSILALVADRQIREEEVSGRHRSVKVGHAGHEHAGQDGEGLGRLGHAAVRDGPSGLERREEEEVGLVGKGDVLHRAIFAFEDAQRDDGRRIDRSSVGRGWSIRESASKVASVMDTT